MRTAKDMEEEYFNSRPCARGDPVLHVIAKLFKHFNSRPCARGDEDGGKQR